MVNSNIERAVDNAAMELMYSTQQSQMLLTTDSVKLINKALNEYKKIVMQNNVRNYCNYCSSGVYTDDFGRIHNEYNYCPICGNSLIEGD